MSDPNFDRAIVKLVRHFAEIVDSFAIICVTIAPEASAILLRAARELRAAYSDPEDRPS